MFMDHETIPCNLAFHFLTQTLPEKVRTTESDAKQSLKYSYRLLVFLGQKTILF